MAIEKHYGIWRAVDSDYLLTTGPDYISGIIKQGFTWENEVQHFAKELIGDHRQPVILDIGANLGAFTVPLARAMNGRKAVFYAFEPQRAIFHQLCGNLFINDIYSCEALNTAIGDYDGYIDIPVYNIHQGHNNGGLSLDPEMRKDLGWENLKTFRQIRIAKLDSLELPPATLIKIDVEGWELDVIRGGLEYIKYSNFPPIIFELWGDRIPSGVEKGKELVRLVKDLGYHIFQWGETCIAQHQSKPIIELAY